MKKRNNSWNTVFARLESISKIQNYRRERLTYFSSFIKFSRLRSAQKGTSCEGTEKIKIPCIACTFLVALLEKIEHIGQTWFAA